MDFLALLASICSHAAHFTSSSNSVVSLHCDLNGSEKRDGEVFVVCTIVDQSVSKAHPVARETAFLLLVAISRHER